MGRRGEDRQKARQADRQSGRDAGELTGNQEAIEEDREIIFLLTPLCVFLSAILPFLSNI